MEKKIQYSFSVLSMMLFLAFTVVSGKLTAIYENNQPVKLFTIAKPLALACNASDTSKIVWMKEDKDVRNIEDLKGHFKIYPKEGRFVIEKAREEDAGNYSCNLDGESYKFDVWAQVIVKIPQNTYVVENDKLELTCIVKGTRPEITWYYSNSSEPDESSLSEIFENDRIQIVQHADIDRSRLIIDQVLLSDHGTYFCNGTNTAMYNMDVISSSDGMVRVKGKLAALWPFLGICAEVFILCTIILIYEKRRNKTDLDESDTDQSPDQKNDHHIKDSDVRHRK